MLLRIISAVVMLPLLLAVVWLLPPWGTLVLALIAVALAVWEYAALSLALGVPIPRLLSAAGAMAACAAFVVPEPPLAIVLSALVVSYAAVALTGGQPTRDMLAAVASAAFAALWIGMPLGTVVAVRSFAGAEAVLPLIFTIVVSDSAQYYAGRTFGRHKLAPAISPKKTVEGAIGGLIAAVPAMIWAGSKTLPAVGWEWLALLGAAIAALGMAGDLFESAIKRAADVKDSSTLIPGHGGVLDRLDGWFFAAPVYYAFLRSW
ncbi:MAG: phosphatidate cytidylyltransferase [Acidobacteriota bacterium]|nr:phosphatidate cytidylyltransferase [Acidobacteriota bacterium]